MASAAQEGVASSPIARRFTRSVGSALLLNLASKVVTFALSTLLTRNITAATRGVGFTFEVYTNTAMFLLREAIRMANARNVLDADDPASIALIANTGALAVCLSAVVLVLVLAAQTLGLLGGLLTPLLALDASSGAQTLWLAMYVGGLGLELASEPAQALMQAALLFKARVAAESCALAAKMLVCIAAFTALGSADAPAAVVYAAAQLVYGAFVCAFMWHRALRAPAATAPPDEWTKVHHALFRQHQQRGALLGICADGMCHAASRIFPLWRDFALESVVRLVLTEGERVVLAARGTLAAQGVYDVVTNLSNVFTRLVFRVWEDACFNAWSKMAPDDSLAGRREAMVLLRRMLRFAQYIGVVFVVFGPPLAATALRVLYGARWAGEEATRVMAATCFLTPLFGINGLVEAFVRAVAPRRLLRRSQAVMTLTSLFYLGGSYWALRAAGIEGLIYANCVNMGLRIITSAVVIGAALEAGSFFEALGSVLLNLDAGVAVTALVAFFVCRLVDSPALVVFVCAPVFTVGVILLDAELRQLLRSLVDAVRCKLQRSGRKKRAE